MKKYVLYIRNVNRPKTWYPDRSEVGQREAVNNYLIKHGGRIVAEFTIPPNRLTEAEQIAEALKICRKQQATLLIPYLEKLEKEGVLMGALLRAGVVFQVVDVASGVTKRLVTTLNTAAAVNRKKHSEKIKAGISKSARKRKASPSSHRLTPEAIKKGRKISAELRGWKARAHAEKIRKIIGSWDFRLAYPDVRPNERGEVNLSPTLLAKHLNEYRAPTAQGKIGNWDYTKAKRVIARIGLLEEPVESPEMSPESPGITEPAVKSRQVGGKLRRYRTS